MVVWSYSLFGNNKEAYYKPMLANVQVAKAVGAKVVISTTDMYETAVKEYFSAYIDDIKINVYSSSQFTGCEMILRFLAVDSVNADSYFIKDADSIVSDRELSIMNDWMQLSTEPYIIIRDNPIHIAPILAGMFGFRRSERAEFVMNCHNYFVGPQRSALYGMDQQWLADNIYPKIRSRAQVYSSYFYFQGEKLIRTNRSLNSGKFIGAQSEENINPRSMQTYFERFYGDSMLTLPFFSDLPHWLSHLIYGRVRPSLYLALLFKWFKR